MIRLLLISLILLTSACASTTPTLKPDPVAALEAYKAALKAGDAVEAYAYLDPALRQGMNLAIFERFLQRHQAALVDEAEGLLRLARSGSGRHESWVQRGPLKAHLVMGPEGWRLSAPPGRTLKGNATPQ